MKLHHLTVATAAVTFVLLLVGGLVHGTGSSLACPDWPTCHGTFFPRMDHGVEFEHSHRLVAALAATMTFVQSALLWRDRRYKSLRPLVIAAPAMVLVQAVLGGITVLLRLPKAVTLAHLTLSMCFFSVLVFLAIRTRFLGLSKTVELAPDAPVRALLRLRGPVGATAATVLGQIFLGGFVRHSMAGLACTTFPLWFGYLWPPISSSVESERIHMLHRMGAAAVAFMVISHGLLVARRARGISCPAAHALKWLGLVSPILVVLQILLGVFSVTSLLHLPTVTAHLGIGAALLASQVAMWTFLSPRLVTYSRAAHADERGAWVAA